jgi:hypothetical protein
LDIFKRSSYFDCMSTVAEIVEAVQQLTPEQKRELLVRLEPVLLAPFTNEAGAGAGDTYYRSAEFTTRLVEHFYRAKCAALSRS